MRFVCESCRAQYMINDEKVGPKGVKVRCRKCGYVILVKRSDAGASASAPVPSAPVAMSNDPDDALATQVMQNPMEKLAPSSAGPEATIGSDTNPGEDKTVSDQMAAAEEEAQKEQAKAEGNGAQNGAGSKASFLGADDDEIGAVFDQVLKTGPTQLPKEGLDESKNADDRESTRVIDGELVKKLAEESGAQAEAKPETPPADEVPQTDWYVAINDKQTGPLTLDDLKQHWDRGEVGPDSLCWRAGFNDWVPLSEVKTLASVLAPKPAKPIVVAAPQTVAVGAGAAMVGSVVSVPVQSAFSAGGMMQTVQSEMQVPMAAASASPSVAGEETGTWRPSAASALASLVKDEMEALAKPASAKKAEPIADEVAVNGLLDLPSTASAGDEKSNGNGAAHAETTERSAPQRRESRSERSVQAPLNPYMASSGATYSAPAMTQYRPPTNRNLIIGIAAGGGVVLIALIGLVIWLAVRPPVVVQQPIAVAPVNPQPVNPPPVNPQVAPPPANTQPVAAQPTTQPPATGPANAQPANPPPANAQPTTQPVNPQPTQRPLTAQPNARTKHEGGTRVARADKEPSAEAPKKAEKAEKEDSGDDFAKAFGGSGGSEKKAAAAEEPPKKKADVWIPPAPGQGSEVKASLSTSDIMEVVLANKGALAKCAEEQHKREPGVTGKLVMKWSIQTSGKSSNIAVASDEYKSTYMASCVGGVIKGMSFPRTKTPPEPVTFPFKF